MRLVQVALSKRSYCLTLLGVLDEAIDEVVTAVVVVIPLSLPDPDTLDSA